VSAALEELRESLREAAHRDVAARRAARGRRRRRAAAAVVLILAGGGAAAQATNVFESGPAAPEIRGLGPRYAPAPGIRRQIAVKLRVPGVPLPLGVAVYTTGDGRTCALAGAVNRSSLGDLVDGTFRPFPADRVGTCNVPERATIDTALIGGRAVVYGLAAAGTRVAVLRETGAEFRVGPDRAFLFVVATRRPMAVDMRE
jgi:hypothetical protein